MSEGNPNAQMTNTSTGVSSFGFRHSSDIRHSTFVIRSICHSLANRIAAVLMKLLFGSVARIRVLRRENANYKGGFLLAANHISHFDPLILSAVVRRKIDWMAMAEFFPRPFIGSALRAVDAFPAERDRADRATIRNAIGRLRQGRIVGIFPEGGIRDGSRSLLEGAPLRPGASTLGHMAGVPILPCVILGTDRLYSIKNWLPLRRTPVWVAFGDPIPNFPNLEKAIARERIHDELAAAFSGLYRELREKFKLTPGDLPHPPRERMRKPVRHPERSRGIPSPYHKILPQDSSTALCCAQNDRRGRLQRASARTIDSLICASMNLVQSRHRLHARSREEMERYIVECEKITARDFYAAPTDGGIANAIRDDEASTITWPSPLATDFPRNNIARAEFFPCARGWIAPTVFMLHALMSATSIGYRRWARHFNELGWNACFVHLPYHYSRVPRGYLNGELAITPDLIRNAEGLRQGVLELRQLMRALREHGCHEFGILGASYGGWIGALLASVESDFRFVALMAPIVNVEHAVWKSPASAFMRRELRRAKIDPALVARHFHLSSPLYHEPLCGADRVLFVAGDFDLIAPPADIEAIHEKWHGSELLRVRQGHFGYRMMRETVARLKQRGL
jgi:1-acyl-sn-glycerol-3-phosphate acyltransferase